MGVPGAVQCRLFNPSASAGEVTSWSLPAWVLGMVSPSVGMSLGSIEAGVYLHSRIAKEMGVADGGEVEIEFVAVGEWKSSTACDAGICCFQRLHVLLPAVECFLSLLRTVPHSEEQPEALPVEVLAAKEDRRIEQEAKADAEELKEQVSCAFSLPLFIVSKSFSLCLGRSR